MASLIEDLIESLHEEKQCYEELLVIGQEKTKVIIEGDASTLVELTKKEQEFVSRVIGLDKKRTGIIEDIALVTNKDANQLTISHLAELLVNEKEEHEQLVTLKDNIKEVVEAFKTVNDRNKILLQESLDYIDFTMNAIQSVNAIANANYQSEGNTYNHADSKRLFDAKQ